MTDSNELAKAIANAEIERNAAMREKFDKETIIKQGRGYLIRDVDGRISIEFKRPTRLFDITLHALRDCIGNQVASSYGVKFPGAIMTRNIEHIEKYITDNYTITDFDGMQDIIDFFKAQYAVEDERMQKVIESGRLEFEDLAYLYKKDDKVCFGEGEGMIGGTIAGIKFVNTWTGTFAAVEINVIHNLTGKIVRDIVTTAIPAYEGLRNISDLPIIHLDKNPVAMAALVDRGKKFRDYALGAHYVQYGGHVVRKSWMSDTSFRAEGRVMIDASTFNRIDSDGYSSLLRRSGLKSRSGYGDDNEDTTEVVINDDMLFMTWPYVFGFSFRAKMWGQMAINSITAIKYREDAYERLVMPDNQKKMIRALVEHNGTSFSDIIDDKGGGCIFMLHGEPGQGKTLTAETIAELLHRPLYAVSVGELGTDPDALEQRLREILDVATVWNAVLLLDEADIFLEARDEHDILRNAMVGVFLRLLEYHQGVLFLTTNRVRNIDRAFYSRISVAVKFDKADDDKREKIWRNLLSAAKIDLSEKEISALAKFDVNGRQVKNVIRLSQTLSRADKSKVTFETIRNTLEMSTQFERDMVEANKVIVKNENVGTNVRSFQNNK